MYVVNMGIQKWWHWSSATIGGKSVEDVLKDNAERTKDATKETLRHAVIEDGWQIFNRKGNTCYGIAAATTAIVKSILFNENRIYPVSVHLDGQYGMNDIFLSVPTIIDKTVLRKSVEINYERRWAESTRRNHIKFWKISVNS